uniref:Uncharacterized protein n=2 Tax=Oryza TaxID=4527 RepID=Q10QB1_ORYSJ|nr:hypothetical protein LOC_Os03g10550 [Oryza sativa Japonica Group]
MVRMKAKLVYNMDELRTMVRDAVGQRHVDVRSLEALRDAPAVFDILHDLSSTAGYGWKVRNIQPMSDLSELVGLLQLMKWVNIPQLLIHLCNLDQRREMLLALEGFQVRGSLSVQVLAQDLIDRVPASNPRAHWSREMSATTLKSRLEEATATAVNTLLNNSIRAETLARQGGGTVMARVRELRRLLRQISNAVLAADHLPPTIGSDLEQAIALIRNILQLPVQVLYSSM